MTNEKKLDVLQKVAQPVRRLDEPSFVKQPLQSEQQNSAFKDLLVTTGLLANPLARLTEYRAYVEKHPGHRDGRLCLARELLLGNMPSQAREHLDVVLSKGETIAAV